MSNFVKIDQVSWCFIWLCSKVHLFVAMCAHCRILPFIKSVTLTSILTPNSLLNLSVKNKQQVVYTKLPKSSYTILVVTSYLFEKQGTQVKCPILTSKQLLEKSFLYACYTLLVCCWHHNPSKWEALPDGNPLSGTWVFSFTFQAYTLPHTLNVCQPI